MQDAILFDITIFDSEGHEILKKNLVTIDYYWSLKAGESVTKTIDLYFSAYTSELPCYEPLIVKLLFRPETGTEILEVLEFDLELELANF